MKGQHFINVDLIPDLYFGNPCWFNGQVKAGLQQLESYLAKVARFQELHGA